MQKLLHSEVVLELLNPSRETIQAISMERGWKQSVQISQERSTLQLQLWIKITQISFSKQLY